MSDEYTHEWEAVILVEGQVSPGGKFAAPGSVKWPNLPIPLTSPDGGAPLGVVQDVRREGDKIIAKGIAAIEFSRESPPFFSPAVAVKKADVSEDRWELLDGELGAVAVIPLPAAHPALDYDVRVCSARCGYDAAYQPPEIKRCPNCNSILAAVPLSMMEEWSSDAG